MSKGDFRTLLVIGDNHEAISFRYSLGHEVEPYVRYRKEDKAKLRATAVEEVTRRLKGVEKDSKYYTSFVKLVQYYSAMSDDEYFEYLCDDPSCHLDGDGNIVSTENMKAEYQFEKCYDARIKKDQSDEAPFCNPFILKDGTKAYSARKGDIDWNKMHLNEDSVKEHERVWELAIEKAEPKDDGEAMIQKLGNREDYFSNFKDKEAFVVHNASFWTYAIATEEFYECGERYDAIEWASKFFDTIIEPLSDDTLLTLYQIKLL